MTEMDQFFRKEYEQPLLEAEAALAAMPGMSAELVARLQRKVVLAINAQIRKDVADALASLGDEAKPIKRVKWDDSVDYGDGHDTVVEFAAKLKIEDPAIISAMHTFSERYIAMRLRKISDAEYRRV